MKWIILLPDSRQYGPFTPYDLRNLAASGRLKPDHQLRPENGNSWYMAYQLRGLFPNAVFNGGEQPVDMETGFQPAPYGNFAPSDGCAAGVRRLAFSRFGLALIVGLGCLLAYRHYGKPMTNEIPTSHAEIPASIVASELPTRIEQWKAHRAKLANLLTGLEYDRIQILERLKHLGITSVEQIAANPRAKVFAEELRDVLRQKESCQKQLDQFDVAILKGESHQRSMERKLSARDAGTSDKELDDLTRDSITLDDKGASERRPSVPLELDGALARELESFRKDRAR